MWNPHFSHGAADMHHRFAVLAILAVVFPFAAWADLVGTVTLSGGDRLILDTGEVLSTTTTAGDLRFTTSSLVSQGNAGIFNYKTSGSAGTTLYNTLTQQMLSSMPAANDATTLNLNGAALVVGDVFAVHTNGGFYAKVLISSFGSNTLGLQYTTFGAAAGGVNAPQISAIENAATNLPPGLPNAPIARRHLDSSDRWGNHGERDHVLLAGRPGRRHSSFPDACGNGNSARHV